MLAGRGFGKTRTGAEFIRDRIAAGARRLAFVAPTAADARDTMVEGESGILAKSASWDKPLYEPSKRRLTWPNGATATLFSAEQPNRLRGPQYDTAWCDELAAWKYPVDTWDNLQFGLRLGDPACCVTTTPRPTPLLKDILSDPATAVTRGSTFDNEENLADSFLRKVKRKYEGTRIGRQELFAELLEDTPGALWTLALFESNRVRHAPDLVRVVVAVDPAGSSDEEAAETGIVAAGVSATGEGYLLADDSGHYTPGEWGEKTVLLHDAIQADAVVVEVNNGGEMCAHVVRTAAQELHRAGKRSSPHINVISVHASRGKITRAEPISALDEQHRIHHVGTFSVLEDQCSTWVPGQKSPDRMDARVWAFSALMLNAVADESPSVRVPSSRSSSRSRR